MYPKITICLLFAPLQDIQVDVVVVLNDATGTLLAGSYVDHTCHIGAIMGRNTSSVSPCVVVDDSDDVVAMVVVMVVAMVVAMVVVMVAVIVEMVVAVVL